EHLLRTDPVVDMEGFFIALFVRKTAVSSLVVSQESEDHGHIKQTKEFNGQNQSLRKKPVREDCCPSLCEDGTNDVTLLFDPSSTRVGVICKSHEPCLGFRISMVSLFLYYIFSPRK
ncbi:hypothetical protein MKW92_023363, partial [Papaver armeniacum]